MAIKMRQKNKEGEAVIETEITNSHISAIKNIIQKYKNITNEAQALDFAIKSIGYDDEVADGVTINGITYSPDDYEQEG